MAYADLDFYKNTYKGTKIPDAELDSYLEKASDNIDLLTFYKIHKAGGIDQLSDFRQTKIQYATCYQADTVYQYKDIPEGLDSYSIGDVSVKLTKSSYGFYLSSESIAQLLPTGLLDRRL